jgi:hypothetical protein
MVQCIYEGGSYDSKDGMSTLCWAPPAWMFLGCIGRNYPTEPTDQQKVQYANFFFSLQHVLPCGSCRDNLVNNLKVLKWFEREPEIFRTRETLSRAINDLHNSVNVMLGKSKQWTYEEHRSFFETFRAACVPNKGKIEGGCFGTRPLGGPRPRCIMTFIAATKAILTLAGVSIICRDDGYIPISEFLEAGGKSYKDLMTDFRRKGRLSQLLAVEASKIVALGKSDEGLIKMNSFLHPRAALVIALNWFKPEIASQAMDWYYRYLSGASLAPKIVSDQILEKTNRHFNRIPKDETQAYRGAHS